MSYEHATGNNHNDLEPNCKDVCVPTDVNCDCADGKLVSNSSTNSHGLLAEHQLRSAASATQKTMTSCAVHPTKNGHDDQAEHSLSSSSSSSSKNSASADSEKKTKALKSLIKKRIDPNQDFIKSHNKRVKFSETMQVFLYEMPDNQMPQIIALKTPAELNLMEFQQYMFEPPAEYQDYLTFEPPPDYRDFIANSLGVFRNEVTFDYIDDDGDDDSESGGANVPSQGKQSKEKKSNHISSLMIANDSGQNSKWQSMILDNNLDSLEEEQIIGVLKEDDILQAIGSQVSLPVSSDPNGPVNGDRSLEESLDSKGYAFEVLDPHEHYEENLSSEDFPVHHQLNSYLLNSSGNLDEEDEDACCIDSSPNGSLQDLASDSSITSQDTIILINQNKSFHLEPLRSATIGADQGIQHGMCVEDNIYENVQNRSNGDHSLLSSGALFDEGKQESGALGESSQEKRDIAVPPDKAETEGIARVGQQQQQFDVLYENTSELLANVGANAPCNHMSNLNENRLSASCSDDSKLEGGVESAKNNHSVASKFKQNLMFYENMMQQNIAAVNSTNPNVNSKHVPSENGRAGPNAQRTLALGVASADASHLIPVRFPVYTIVDTNRTSSSSSLSSTSSSSSSMISNNTHISQTLSVTANQNNNLSTSPNPIQQAAQVSPNSSSTSSSSSTGMPHEYLVQYGQRTMVVPGKRPELSEVVGQAAINNAVTSNAPNFAVSSTLDEANMNALFVNANSLQHQQQQHSPRPKGPPSQPSICVVNNNANQNGHGANSAIRPGQVVYRYPYAFIQHSAANGVQTIRPVQYILQTNPQTGAQSVIYNPRLVINSHNNNQPATYLSPAPNGSSVPSSGAANNMANLPPSSSSINTSAPLGQAQMMSTTGHGPDSTVTIPVRRIIVPQGTMLAPRIMHLHPHPQHKQAPPPYQYYVQQRQQQAIFAYQQNVPLRPAGPPSSGQVHTVDVNNQNHSHTEFPNPSEIRRRDGLYAYPQVLLKAEEGKATSQGVKAGDNSDLNCEERDELEEFVQQEQQRTDRIKKRYSFTEDDDPTFGFARRPSVRGIRPKFSTTNEIIQQMTSTLPKPPMQQKIVAMNSSNVMSGQQPGNPVFAYGTIPKNAQFININHAGPGGHPQMISIVKQMGDVQLGDNSQPSVPVHLKAQTLPRQLQTMNKMPNGEQMPVSAETVRIMDANGMMNGPNASIQMVNCATMSRDQLKLQLQKQLDRQMQQQQKPQVATRVAQHPGASVMGQRSLGGDERGVPEGASFSPNHPSGGAEGPGGTPFGGGPPKDSKSLVVEGNKPNVDMAQYYSLNV